MQGNAGNDTLEGGDDGDGLAGGTGNDLLITPEHALHVLEVIQATRESQETGRRVTLSSRFRWPVVT